jgi:hypothetical protein
VRGFLSALNRLKTARKSDTESANSVPNGG